MTEMNKKNSGSAAGLGTAVITGGTRGIGRACVRAFADAGYRVAVVYHSSSGEAEKLKRQLFDDLLLRPVLAFTSPSGHGVKAFIPYDLARIPDTKQNTSENIHWAMNYVQAIYDFHSSHPDREDKKTNHSGKGVDRSGKDLVRACFLSYDEEALIRREI